MQKADQALVEGDRAGVAECIGQLYSLFDWQLSLARHQGDDRKFSGQLHKLKVRRLH